MYDAGSIQASLDLDRTPFQQSLKRATAEGNRFDGKKFTAKADLNTTRATAQAKRLEALLNKIRGKRAGAFVSVNGVAKTLAGLRSVDKMLDKIDGRRATAHVEIDKDGAPTVATLRLLSQTVQALIPNLQGLTTAGTTSGKALEGVSVGSSGLAANFGKAGPAAAALAAAVVVAVPVVVSLGAALAAIVASAAAATAGMGALAIAGGGALAAGLALGIGAMQRYKATADQAGTAANGLKKALGGVKGAFAGATARGSDAIFRGLSTMLRSVRPAITRLRSDFTALGRAVGGALRGASPQIKTLIRSFGQLVRATAPLAGPLVRSLTALGQILVNIATAAMPFLVSGAKSVARTLESWGKTTGASTLGKTIQGLVGHLRSWLSLGKQVGRIFLGFFKAAAPAGKGLVDSLAKGAKALADWIASAKGQNAIKKFLDDVIPLAKDVAKLFPEIAKAVISFTQKAAPRLETLFKAIRIGVKVVSWLANAFIDVQAAFEDMYRWSIRLGREAPKTWDKVKAAVSKAWTAIKKAVSSGAAAVWNTVKKAWDRVKGATTTGWNAVKKAVSDAWNKIKTTATQGAQSVAGVVRGAWNRVKSATTTAWNAAKQAVTQAWNQIKSTVSKGAADVVAFVKALPGKIKGALGDLGSLLIGAGKALMEGLINGIESMAQRAVDAVKNIVGKARDLLPGSEPRDPNSPLRRLDLAGAATMRNYATGIHREAPRAVEAMASAARRVSAAGRQISEEDPRFNWRTMGNRKRGVTLGDGSKRVVTGGQFDRLQAQGRLSASNPKMLGDLGRAVDAMTAAARGVSAAGRRVTEKPLGSYDRVGSKRPYGGRGRFEDEVVYKGRYVPMDDISRGPSGRAIQNRAEKALATVRRGIRAGGVDALLAIGRADDRIHRMLRSLPKGAKGKGLLQNVLGDLRELSAYERKVADIGDRLRELSKEATEGFIDRRLQDQLRAIATGPEAQEIARLQGLDRETERGSRDAELAGQYDEARRMQNPRRADETEADYEERRRRGEAQQREVEDERGRETRRRRIEDLERTMAGRTNTAEESAESARVNPRGDREVARFGSRLEARLDVLLKQLGAGRIGPEMFQNRARRALGAGGVGFTLPYEDRLALADKPDLIRGRRGGADEGRDRGREDRRDQRENRREDARDARDRKREDARDRRDRGRGSPRTVIENLHIKTIPAAQKPDGPYTAAQISQLVRNLGGVPG